MGINSIRRWNTSNKIQKTVMEKTTTKTRYAKLSGRDANMLSPSWKKAWFDSVVKNSVFKTRKWLKRQILKI